MRLYTVIDNKTFVKQILLNQAINASVKASDFRSNSFNTEISSYLDRFLYYINRESWSDNAIYCYTCPSSFEEETISDKEVVISFEVSEKDVILLDYDKFLDFTYQFDMVKNETIMLKENAEMLKKYFSDVEKNVFKVDNYFGAICFVNEILSNTVKSATIKKTNPIAPLLQINKNKIYRRVPMQYFGEENKNIKNLLKHKPKDIHYSNKKFLTSAEKI